MVSLLAYGLIAYVLDVRVSTFVYFHTPRQEASRTRFTSSSKRRTSHDACAPPSSILRYLWFSVDFRDIPINVK